VGKRGGYCGFACTTLAADDREKQNQAPPPQTWSWLIGPILPCR
jgi:hypothetical protein